MKLALAVLLFCAATLTTHADTVNLGAPGSVAAGTVLTLPLDMNAPVEGTDDIAVTFAGESFTSASPVDIGLIMYTSGGACDGMANGWGTLTGQAPMRLGNGCGYTIVGGVKVDPWLAVGLVGADASSPVYGMDFAITFPVEPGVTVTSADFLIGFSGNGIIQGDPTPAPRPTSTPEPSDAWLLGFGLFLLFVNRQLHV